MTAKAKASGNRALRLDFWFPIGSELRSPTPEMVNMTAPCDARTGEDLSPIERVNHKTRPIERDEVNKS